MAPTKDEPDSGFDKDIEKMSPDALGHSSPSDETADEEEREEEESDHHALSTVSTRRGRSRTVDDRSSMASGRQWSRHSSVLSTVRSRNPNQFAPFTHKLSHVATGQDVLVDYEGPDDPYCPLNWPMKKKIVTTLMYGFTTMGATLASSIFSAGIAQVKSEFNVGNEVATLGTSFLLLGFGLGPLFWAPLSEVYGRKPAVLTPYFLAAIFSFGCGAGKDIQTVLICRFFVGFFGSAPVTNTGGVLGDVWSMEHRGLALIGYAFAVVGGPLLGPIIGGAICLHTTWRWTEYLTGLFMMTMLTLDVVLLDESYTPVLLVYKARRLRIGTGNWALHAPHEEWDVSIKDLANKYMVRPFQMLATPICFLIALYASFVYGILYSFLAAFPVEFQEVRGWNDVVGALPFLSLLVGVFIGGGLNVLNQRYFVAKLKAAGGRPVPEARLPPMMGGGIFLTSGLFLFAWTSDPHVFWFPSQVGGVLVGIGFFCVFQAGINYLVDTFQKYGASAIGANTFLRSCFAAAFPLFITPELHNLGVGPGLSVFAGVATLMIPIPYFFFVYGRRIRARGYWSQESL